MLIKIDNNFKNIFDISSLDTLEIVNHIYGIDTHINEDEFCWLAYNQHSSGSIWFTRNTHKFIPEFCKYVNNYIKTFFNISIDLTSRIHIMKTTGNLPWHVDEANRKCCLNIGLKNTNTAITKMKINDKILETRCEDNSMYLLDTSKQHCLNGNNEERYLITCGFGTNYETILSALK